MKILFINENVQVKETLDEISKRYPIYFLEIGTDKDHVHFLIQSVNMTMRMQ